MLTPGSEAELAEAVAAAEGPLCIEGGGTRGLGVAGARLSTRGLSGITLYEPGALTLVARAGTPVAEIDAALAAENQRLAFEPMDHRPLLGGSGTPTIGAVLAANVSGPRRIQAGAARDFALGVRFVDGTGAVVKNGGRVMKNVTGYDLVRLMCGAHGTLGILTEVSLKVLPRTETQATLALDGLAPDAAVAALSAGLGSPFEVTGAAYLPDARRAVLRIEGFADSVAYRAERLRSLLAGRGEVEVLSEAESAALWRDIRDVEALAGRPGDVWRISVRPSDAPGILARIEADASLLDWGGGLIWALLPADTDLRARLGAFAGHATLVRAGAETRARLGVFQPQPAALARIADGLRAKFDPEGILNRGLMDAPTEAMA